LLTGFAGSKSDESESLAALRFGAALALLLLDLGAARLACATGMSSSESSKSMASAAFFPLDLPEADSASAKYLLGLAALAAAGGAISSSEADSSIGGRADFLAAADDDDAAAVAAAVFLFGEGEALALGL